LDINKYCGYFHDGGLISIKYIGNNIGISMYSAEITKQDLLDDLILSDQNRIKGILHLCAVDCIRINNDNVSDRSINYVNGGDIVNFNIQKNTVILSIDWMDRSSASRKHIFSNIEIQAKKIWWENIPELYDPFW
jgi:hypothetical protein